MKDKEKYDVAWYTIAIPSYNRSILNSEGRCTFSFASHKSVCNS